MDRAFQAFAANAEPAPSGLMLVHAYGLQPHLLAVTQVWQPAAGAPLRVAAKGAPEAIAELCRLDTAARAALARDVDRMAEAGLRVLAVAEAVAEGELPRSPRSFGFRPVLLTRCGAPSPPRSPSVERPTFASW
jgi:Ca2+-transporting ATPase